MIEVKHLTKTYGKGERAYRALEDVNFSIPEGSSLAIVGKSGSGKSTLMHAMSGLDRPQEGEVRIGDQDILKLRSMGVDRFRSRDIGFIFQSFFVQTNETCYENVSLALEIRGVPHGKRRELIEKALRRVELDEKIYERAGNLSGGQKQRLAIARAIAGSPKVLFADEPTGNLDSTTGAVIEDMLFEYNRREHTTLIIVTHDHELAARCDGRIHITDGKAGPLIKASHA